MSIPEATIQNILSSSDIVEVIEGYVRLTKSGRNFKARCPFHNEKTPSFMVNPEKQIFHCFGCNIGGNAIGFIMKMEGLTYPEAIRKLAKKCNIEINETYSKTNDKLSEERDAIYKILNDAGLFFQKHLAENAVIKNYLKKRGLTDETIEKFQIGYAPKSSKTLLSAAVKKGYSKDLLYKSGVISNEKDFFINRVMFPIFDITGRIVAFGGRVLDDATEATEGSPRGRSPVGAIVPKYLNSPETAVYSKSRVLYGLNFAGKSIRENNSAVILEGYVDVIMCHQYGITNTVATLGTAFTPQHSSLLKRYTDNITIAYDPDTAGRSSAIRSCEVLLNDDLYVKIAQLPDGKDSDEILISDGADKLKNIFSNSKSYIDFFIDEKSDSFDVKTIEGKRGLIKLAIPVISKIPNAVVKSEYIKALSERLAVREEIIKEELSRLKTEIKRYGSDSKQQMPPAENKINIEERNIISVLAGDIKLMDYIPEDLQIEFNSGEIKNFFETLRMLRKKGRDSITSAELVEIAGSDVISKILTAGDFKPSDPEKFVKSFADAVSIRMERKKLDKIKVSDMEKFVEISRKMKGSKKEHGTDTE
ncbi:MAG: DNA primase [Elusimicrobia bacterium]|nr:DNA primase [Elusimicrobiota bacterium]